MKEQVMSAVTLDVMSPSAGTFGHIAIGDLLFLQSWGKNVTLESYNN